MIYEETRDVQRYCFERWTSWSQVCVAVVNDKYVLAILCCFLKRAHNIHSDKVEGSKCWEELPVLLMARLLVVPCADRKCAHDKIEVGGHVGPLKVAI